LDSKTEETPDHLALVIVFERLVRKCRVIGAMVPKWAFRFSKYSKWICRGGKLSSRRANSDSSDWTIKVCAIVAKAKIAPNNP